MARIFTYGELPTVTKVGNFLPGMFETAWGVNLNAPAYRALDLAIEYGEILKIEKAGNGYKVARVDAVTTSFGVLVRTRDGQINLEAGMIEAPRKEQTASVYPLAAPNYFRIAVLVEPGQTPVVGEAVFVTNAGDNAGAVRVNITGGTALTGWVFASTKYKPTSSDSEAVIIERTV